METNSNAAAGGGETTNIVAIAPVAPESVTSLSTRDAASLVSRRRATPRKKIDNQPDGTDRGEEPARAEPSTPLADEADAAPEQAQAPGETQATEPEQLPPIEPPRSWTKEEKERFKSYPRELQAYLLEREQERDRELRRSQNEAADQRKAIDAERAKVAQARQHYETALPVLLQSLLQQQAGEFSDIRTIDDIERLARDDWPRYAQWDAQQKKIMAVQQQLQAAQARQTQDLQKRWTTFAEQQDQLFVEKVPEFADRTKATKLQDSAINVLKDRGFTDQELQALHQCRGALSLRDHRLQLLILDAVKFHDAQKAAKEAAAKPVPPVQRPGVAQPPNAAAEHHIQNLKQKLDQSGSLKDAAALVAARRKAAR